MLSASLGRPLMPWQQLVVDVALELDEAGRFAYRSVAVTVPRQSGKTTLFGAVCEHRALTLRAARVWFTMQSHKDAVDWLLNEHWPTLARYSAELHLRRQTGSEGIRWRRGGGMFRPFPPLPAALHGKTSDLVVVDECWAFNSERGQQLDQAIVPTQATKADAQVWKASTAGDVGSTWWLGTVEAGRQAVEAGRTSGLAYFDWSCPDDVDPTEPASWPVYHPAYGITVGPEAMQAALDQLGPDEFARAYGNRWVSTTARVIPLEVWRAAAEEPAELPAAGEVALGFDVAVDRSDASIVAAWRDELGRAHLEVVAHELGTSWIVERLGELVDRWRPRAIAYDRAGPALDVGDRVRDWAGVEGLDAHRYATACALLLEGLTSGGVFYRPHPALDGAAHAAARRALGDAWAWGRRQSSGSLAPLTAATVALYGYDHSPAAAGAFRIY